MTLVGRREPRIEDEALLRGRSVFIGDLGVPGAAHVVYARSIMAHAVLRRVDVEAARQMPGVVAAFTAEDLRLPELPSITVPGVTLDVEGVLRPFLARERVRYVGEALAALVVEDPQLAEDALELVEVDYEPLPAVVRVEDALRDEVLLHEAAGTNVVVDTSMPASTSDSAGDCEVVLRQRMVNHRVLAAPMEVRGCAARWEEDGRVSIWVSTQVPHMARPGFAAMLGVEPDQVRMRPIGVGGGFGAKGFPYPEELLVPLLARILDRPLKWIETRSESMVSLTPGRGQVMDVTLGADRNGKVQAVDFDVVQDAGAYPGMLGAFMPAVSWLVASGPYSIPKMTMRGRTVVTNTIPTGAYRGAGRPEPIYALERMMDMLATELAVDPAEIRRRNLIRPDQYPFTAATGTEYDTGNVPAALERVLDRVGYAEVRSEQKRLRHSDERRRIGVGLAAFVDICGRMSPPDFGSVEVRPDGEVIICTGSSPHGQGHETVWAMLAADEMGVDMARVRVVHSDTDMVPVGGGTFGSKSLQSAGMAVHRAAVGIVDKARSLASEVLEAPVDDIILDVERGSFHVAGVPSRGVGWQDLARRADEEGQPLRDETVLSDARPTFPNGVYVAVVSVDIDTGHVRVERMVTCDDAGRIMNPLIAEGQVHGGLSQGIAQALLEELQYDDDGNPLTTNFADYLIISACEVPSFEGEFQETPSDRNQLGVKGIGESGTVGATPAVVNAVIDALSEFGIHHLEMPLSPERVWAAVRDATPADAAIVSTA